MDHWTAAVLYNHSALKHKLINLIKKENGIYIKKNQANESQATNQNLEEQFQLIYYDPLHLYDKISRTLTPLKQLKSLLFFNHLINHCGLTQIEFKDQFIKCDKNNLYSDFINETYYIKPEYVHVR